MADYSAVARPYAQAIFELAQADSAIESWSSSLQVLSQAAENEDMRKLVANPSFSDERCGELLIDICDSRLDEKARNLVRLLASNGRLAIIPEIRHLYEAYLADAQRIVDAEVISAFSLSDNEQEAIANALRKRLDRNVKLDVKTDKSLIGGAIVRAGDLVIDGSVTGKLDKLRLALVQ